MVILADVLAQLHVCSGNRNVGRISVKKEFRHQHIGSPDGGVVKGEHGIV